MLSRSLMPIALPVDGVVLTPFAVVSCGGANCCVEMVPMFFPPGRPRMLIPNWLMSARFTSANRT